MAEEEKKREGTVVDVNYLDILGDTEAYENDEYVPEGFESKEEFLKDMREQYSLDLEFDKVNRDQALDDKKFSAGEQWDPVVLEQRAGLPCLVINNIPQFTAQLVGDWRESRKAIKVIPSNDEDADVAAVRGDIIRSIEAQSRADRVYDSAFESLVQCGDGALRATVEYARDNVFDQDIFIRPIEDCLAVVWDRYSVDPTARDARRVFVNDKIPKKEFERKYGKELTPSSLEIDSLKMDGWCEEDSYQITEYWRLIERKQILALFGEGQIFEVTADNIQGLIEKYGNPVKVRTSWCTYAQMHLVTGFAILAGPYEYRLNRLPVVRMSGRVVNVNGRRIRYGLVRFMKDAIRLKNFWRSIAAEQLGYAPKAKWIAPESAVEGREDTFRKAHLSRDPLLVYNDGAEAPPTLIPPPPVEASLLNEAAINAQDMKDVTGIHDASLGVRSNETSGRAIMARQREGDIANLTFHDNANAALLEIGDVINQLLPQVMDGTRIVRALGEDETVKFQKLNDPMSPDSIDLSVGLFDVALSTGTSYTTKRVEAAQAMMDAIQVWPNLMGIAGDLVAKAQDWPGADKLAERLQKTIPQNLLSEEERQQIEGAPFLTPEQIQELQMQMAALQEENKTLKQDKTLAFEKLKIDNYNAETARMKALSDHDVDANTLTLKAMDTLINGSKTLDEQEIKKIQLEADTDLKKSNMSAKNSASSAQTIRN